MTNLNELVDKYKVSQESIAGVATAAENITGGQYSPEERIQAAWTQASHDALNKLQLMQLRNTNDDQQRHEQISIIGYATARETTKKNDVSAFNIFVGTGSFGFSDETIRELKEAYKASLVLRAREEFADLQTGRGDKTQLAASIAQHLDAADVNKRSYGDALTPPGSTQPDKNTLRFIKEAGKEAERPEKIAELQRRFNAISGSDVDPGLPPLTPPALIGCLPTGFIQATVDEIRKVVLKTRIRHHRSQLKQ